MEETTQTSIILAELEAGKTITALEAFNLCGTLRLSSIIYKLRGRGYNVVTEMVKRNGKTFAEYSLKEKEDEYYKKEADTSK